MTPLVSPPYVNSRWAIPRPLPTRFILAFFNTTLTTFRNIRCCFSEIG